MNLALPAPVRALLVACALPAAACAQITFAFDYSQEDAGAGFNDATLGATRKAALQSAADTLSGYFSGYAARTVTIRVNASLNQNAGFLASAGSLYFTTSNTFQPGLVATLIQTGVDNNPSYQGALTWNFGYTWDYDDSVAGGTFDFKAVAMHELTHTLGFASMISSSGTSDLGTNVWSTFDQFLTDASGNALINSTTKAYAGGSILSDGFGSDVYFSGSNAMAANGGSRVHIYSPASYAAGSSLSHLDTDFFTSAAYLMEHAVAAGAATRTLSAIELGILTDLGYSVSAVPEPGTYALAAGALALLLAAARRRAA
ncbi:MAG: PEP-CTERM sorting domain-containing protein [Opitutae bacterium]|nr:PEP-CTERM sorting domain-containing protein [Opitutae bacterium]